MEIDMTLSGNSNPNRKSRKRKSFMNVLQLPMLYNLRSGTNRTPLNHAHSICNFTMADDEEAPPAPKWNASSAEDAPAGPFNEEGLPHGHVRELQVPLP